VRNGTTATVVFSFWGVAALLWVGCSGKPDSSHETYHTTESDVRPEVAPFREVKGPFGTTTALAFSSDGHHLLSGVGPFMPGVQVYPIRKWNVRDMTEPIKFEGHQQSVTHLAVASGLPLLASASYDKTVRVWDLVEHREVARLRVPVTGEHERITCLAFNPVDDTLVLCGGDSDRSIIIWDWKQNRVLKSFTSDGWIARLSVEQDGSKVVVECGTGTQLVIAPRPA
jgi:WD40 repeat protein